MLRLGGNVDENRNGVRLALPVHLGVVSMFVDERRQPEQESAFRECLATSLSASVTQAWPRMVSHDWCEMQLRVTLAEPVAHNY